MGSPVTAPWKNQSGELAHPDAPRGGSGPGASRNPRPAGTGMGSNPGSVPSPDSHAARYMPPNELADRVTASDSSSAVGDPKGEHFTDETSNLIMAEVIVQAAEGLISKPTIGSKECFALADIILRQSGGKSADDFEKVTGSDDQDYKWGTPVMKRDDIRPGDIVQLRDHEITVTISRPDGSSNTDTYKRPHHTAIVLAKNPDGSFQVAEQHVQDRQTHKLSPVVMRNTLYIVPNEFKKPDGSEVEIEVSGMAVFYHPVVNKKPTTPKTPR